MRPLGLTSKTLGIVAVVGAAIGMFSIVGVAATVGPAYLVHDITVSPERVTPSDDVTVGYTVVNSGDKNGFIETTIVVEKEGRVRATINPTGAFVAGGDSRSRSHSFRPDEHGLSEGTYNVTVVTEDDRTSTKQLTIQTETSSTASIQIDAPARVSGQPEAPIPVNVTVTNSGRRPFNATFVHISATAPLTLTSTSADETTFFIKPLQPNESRTVRYVVVSESPTETTVSFTAMTLSSNASTKTTVRVREAPFASVVDDEGNNNGVIDAQEVLDTVAAYNSDSTIRGRDVTAERVLNLIAKNESGKPV